MNIKVGDFYLIKMFNWVIRINAVVDIEKDNNRKYIYFTIIHRKCDVCDSASVEWLESYLSTGLAKQLNKLEVLILKGRVID